MIIFPAIDLRNGKAVRLVEGDFKQETVYAEDPAAVAEQFREAGAEFLHVVDLDGALAGESRNVEVIRRILAKAGNMKVEVGGGIRSLQAVSRMMDLGVSRSAVQDAGCTGRLSLIRQEVHLYLRRGRPACQTE